MQHMYNTTLHECIVFDRIQALNLFIVDGIRMDLNHFSMRYEEEDTVKDEFETRRKVSKVGLAFCESYRQTVAPSFKTIDTEVTEQTMYLHLALIQTIWDATPHKHKHK
eukprot:16680_1